MFLYDFPRIGTYLLLYARTNDELYITYFSIKVSTQVEKSDDIEGCIYNILNEDCSDSPKIIRYGGGAVKCTLRKSLGLVSYGPIWKRKRFFFLKLKYPYITQFENLKKSN